MKELEKIVKVFNKKHKSKFKVISYMQKKNDWYKTKFGMKTYIEGGAFNIDFLFTPKEKYQIFRICTEREFEFDEKSNIYFEISRRIRNPFCRYDYKGIKNENLYEQHLKVMNK